MDRSAIMVGEQTSRDDWEDSAERPLSVEATIPTDRPNAISVTQLVEGDRDRRLRKAALATELSSSRAGGYRARLLRTLSA